MASICIYAPSTLLKEHSCWAGLPEGCAVDGPAFQKFPAVRTQILAIFAAAPELCQLVREVEEDYERFLQHPGRRPKGPHAEVLPFLAEQAQAWEASATATSAGASLPTVSFLCSDTSWASYILPRHQKQLAACCCRTGGCLLLTVLPCLEQVLAFADRGELLLVCSHQPPGCSSCRE